jgi:hypothetical protein
MTLYRESVKVDYILSVLYVDTFSFVLDEDFESESLNSDVATFSAGK